MLKLFARLGGQDNPGIGFGPSQAAYISNGDNKKEILK